MKKKLSCILLVDDDYATNYIHKRVINMAGIAEKVIAVQVGLDAIDYLMQKNKEEYLRPDIIFLDINMPGMDGWEFLERYGEMEEVHKGHIVIVMLTTSLNPDDEIKSATISHINGFRNKPLTIEMLNGIIDEYFSDYK